ncbi:MAG: sulfatase-like hydrolase/transferase, partial [Verrucomicrobia bacterium]|nr:sulfatase-like hydrolase/transferase [Verrucomicrobiota bacterium]
MNFKNPMHSFDKRFVRPFAALAVGFLLTLLILPVQAATADSSLPPMGSSSKPNILFILVDDQSPFDLKVYNSKSTSQTPNINRLAEEGTVFDSAYHMGSWSGAVCTPSRHM